MLKTFFGQILTKSNKKVLIVEDDSLLAQVMEEELSAEKIETVIVTDGLEVMGVVKKFKPNLILLDLILPGLDGFAVLKQLKENPEASKIPVIVISNLSEVGDVKSVKALGADKYFIKANTEMSKIVAYIKNKLKI